MTREPSKLSNTHGNHPLSGPLFMPQTSIQMTTYHGPSSNGKNKPGYPITNGRLPPSTTSKSKGSSKPLEYPPNKTQPKITALEDTTMDNAPLPKAVTPWTLMPTFWEEANSTPRPRKRNLWRKESASTVKSKDIKPMIVIRNKQIASEAAKQTCPKPLCSKPGIHWHDSRWHLQFLEGQHELAWWRHQAEHHWISYAEEFSSSPKTSCHS